MVPSTMRVKPLSYPLVALFGNFVTWTLSQYPAISLLSLLLASDRDNPMSHRYIIPLMGQGVGYPELYPELYAAAFPAFPQESPPVGSCPLD